MRLLKYYNNEDSFSLDSVRFRYLSCSWEGRGLLEWSPEEGFELHAFVEQLDGTLPKALGFGRMGVVRSTDRVGIRMRAHGGWRRVRAFNVPLVDRMDVPLERRLSIRLARLVFTGRGNDRLTSGVSAGRAALYGWSKTRIMPEVTRTRRRLPGRRQQEGWATDVVSIGDSVGLRSLAQVETDHVLVHWMLKPRYARLGRWWRWPHAFRDALSILSGTELQLIESEAENMHRVRLELCRRREITRLGFLAPVREQVLDRHDLQRLTRLLFRGGPKAVVARQIFRQLAEASRQRTDAGLELLTATILEAALRTLYEEPFVAGATDNFKTKKALARFQGDYLDSSWEGMVRKVYNAWKRLRHRNAHPDWLVERGASDSWNERAFADLLLLAQFYGVMILSMAGRDDPPRPVVPR